MLYDMFTTHDSYLRLPTAMRWRHAIPTLLRKPQVQVGGKSTVFSKFNITLFPICE